MKKCKLYSTVKDLKYVSSHKVLGIKSRLSHTKAIHMYAYNNIKIVYNSILLNFNDCL